MKSLESRLESVHEEKSKQSLIAHLTSRDYKRAHNRNNPYLKKQLIPTIVNLINAYAPTSVSFASTLDSSINKEEAKRVYYGLVSFTKEPDQYMQDIMKNLTNWEKVYFFAGSWKDCSGKNGMWTERDLRGLKDKTIPEIVREYIKTGIDFLHESHMVKKAKGTYSRKLKLPESQNYHQEVQPKPQNPAPSTFPQATSDLQRAYAITALRHEGIKDPAFIKQAVQNELRQITNRQEP